MKEEIVSKEAIEQKIFLIRGQKIMLDRDLGGLYAFKTKRLNEQVKRNSTRFPEDFMFQLTMERRRNRLHIATGLKLSNILQAIPPLSQSFNHAAHEDCSS